MRHLALLFRRPSPWNRVSALLAASLYLNMTITSFYYPRLLVAVLASNTYSVLGGETVAYGVEIQAASYRLIITSECTYLDLFCALLVLLTCRCRMKRGILVGASVLVVVSLINLLRLIGCMWALDAGVDWTLSHDLPDAICWYGCLAGGVLGLIRYDKSIGNDVD